MKSISQKTKKSSTVEQEYYLIPVEWFNKFIAIYGLLTQDFHIPEFARQSGESPQRFQHHVTKFRKEIKRG